MTPQGIMHLYVENANFYVDNRLKKHQASKISRRDFEVRVLQQLSLSNLTIEYKLAWMNAIINTDIFESFWVSQHIAHNLTDTQLQRYIPDPSLYTIKATPKSSTTSKSARSTKPSPAKSRLSPERNPYDRTTNNAFQEIIDMDLGPSDTATVTAPRKRKKSAKARAADGEDDWQKKPLTNGVTPAKKMARLSKPTKSRRSISAGMENGVLVKGKGVNEPISLREYGSVMAPVDVDDCDGDEDEVGREVAERRFTIHDVVRAD